MAIKSYSDNIMLVELPPEPHVRAELDNLMEILRQGCNCDVIVDFARVNIVVSLSLSGFLKLHKLLAESGRRLLFFNAAAITKDIFRVTCFDGIFEFADHLSDAAARLNEAAKPQPANS